MMDKPKRKNDEQSVWSKLADIILLAKPFEYEVDWSPEECAQRLSKMSTPKDRFLGKRGFEPKINVVDDQIYGFEISIKPLENAGQPYLFASANSIGVILKDEGIQKTIVR